MLQFAKPMRLLLWSAKLRGQALFLRLTQYSIFVTVCFVYIVFWFSNIYIYIYIYIYASSMLSTNSLGDQKKLCTGNEWMKPISRKVNRLLRSAFIL